MIINILLENHIMIHHDICLTMKTAREKVKCKFSFVIQVQTVRKQQKSSVNQFEHVE